MDVISSSRNKNSSMEVKMSCPSFERLVAIVIQTGANRSGTTFWGVINAEIVNFYKKRMSDPRS